MYLEYEMEPSENIVPASRKQNVTKSTFFQRAKIAQMLDRVDSIDFVGKSFSRFFDCFGTDYLNRLDYIRLD